MEARFVVRYGSTRVVGEFSSKGRDNYPRNCQVLVRSDRGVEVGEVLTLASDRTREYLGSTEAKGHILREATAIGEFPGSGEREFLPPEPGEAVDWVLVLDNAAKNYPPPGTARR